MSFTTSHTLSYEHDKHLAPGEEIVVLFSPAQPMMLANVVVRNVKVVRVHYGGRDVNILRHIHSQFLWVEKIVVAHPWNLNILVKNETTNSTGFKVHVFGWIEKEK